MRFVAVSISSFIGGLFSDQKIPLLPMLLVPAEESTPAAEVFWFWSSVRLSGLQMSMAKRCALAGLNSTSPESMLGERITIGLGKVATQTYSLSLGLPLIINFGRYGALLISNVSVVMLY